MAAVGVLIAMVYCKLLTNDYMDIGADETVHRDELDFITPFSPVSRKRKLFIFDPLQQLHDDEDDYQELMQLSLHTIHLLHGPTLRLPRRWWKDPTRPGSMFRSMEVDWPQEGQRHPGKLNENYFWHFRFQYEDFSSLEELLADTLPPCGGDGYWPNLHEPLTPGRKLAITLYWIAKGGHYGEVASVFDVGVSTVCGVVKQVTTT